MTWTEAMEEEFATAKDYFELVCEEDISDYREAREAEYYLKLLQVRDEIENSVI